MEDEEAMPTYKLIEDGIANEAKLLIKQAMGNAHSQSKVVEAQHNHEKIWRKMFKVANVPNPNAPLTAGCEKDSNGELI